MTFGVPVDPLLQIPWVWGDTTSGSEWVGRPALAREIGHASGVQVHLRINHLQDPRELPLGDVPTDRHRDRADLPRGESGQHELGRVPQAEGEPVSDAKAESASHEAISDERRSSSGQRYALVVPSMRTNTSASRSGDCPASWAIRAP